MRNQYDRRGARPPVAATAALAHGRARPFVYGYGDSSTDFTAAGSVGIAVDRTWALLREGESECQTSEYAACIPGYTDHLADVEAPPDGV